MQSQKLILSSDDWVNVTQTLNLTETQFYYIQSRSATEIDYFISPTPPTATDDGLRLFLTQDWPRVQQPVGSFIFARRAQNSNGDGVLIVSPSYAESSGGGGDGDVVGPNSSTDSTIAVFSGATGKIIKEPTGPLLANNQQIKNGAPGTDPNDFVTVSQISAGSGDVVGPNSSTNNGIAIFDGITGKVIKNTFGPTINADGRIENGTAGINSTDLATVEQLTSSFNSAVNPSIDTLIFTAPASVSPNLIIEWDQINNQPIITNNEASETLLYSLQATWEKPDAGFPSIHWQNDAQLSGVGSIYLTNTNSAISGLDLASAPGKIKLSFRFISLSTAAIINLESTIFLAGYTSNDLVQSSGIFGVAS
jgi:hypothetical protein